MSERNTTVIAPKPDVAGYLAWVRTGREPTVEKIDAVHRHMYLSAAEWKAKTIGELIPLTTEECSMCLADLAVKYPCPQENSNGI